MTYGHHNANFKRAVFFTADENSEKGVMKMPSDKDKGSAININDAKKHKKKGMHLKAMEYYLTKNQMNTLQFQAMRHLLKL